MLYYVMHELGLLLLSAIVGTVFGSLIFIFVIGYWEARYDILEVVLPFVWLFVLGSLLIPPVVVATNPHPGIFAPLFLVEVVIVPLVAWLCWQKKEAILAWEPRKSQPATAATKNGGPLALWLAIVITFTLVWYFGVVHE